MSQSLSQADRWRVGDHARHYFAHEREFLRAGIKQSVGPSVLQIGDRLDQSVVDDFDLPYVVQSGIDFSSQPDVLFDPAFLPFSPDSFTTVLLPHVIEGHALPHQVLREAHRVLMPEGHIVLTGFNPSSFIGLQRIMKSKAVCPGKYYTVGRVIDWLQLLGFEVVANSMFQYAPLSKRPRFKKTFSFLESVGDRLLPMTGGGYMISAKKREGSGTLLGRVRFSTPKRKLVAATTKVANHQKSNKSVSDSTLTNS